jgi:hypothetical protein
LPIGKTGGFLSIGVNAPEFLTVRVINGHQPMMVLAAPVLAEVTLFLTSGFLSRSFRHSDDSYTGRSIRHYLRETLFAQVL